MDYIAAALFKDSPALFSSSGAIEAWRAGVSL